MFELHLRQLRGLCTPIPRGVDGLRNAVSLLLLLAVAAGAVQAQANQDELRLRDGTVLRGHAADGETVVSESAGGRRTYPRAEVQAVYFGRRAAIDVGLPPGLIADAKRSADDREVADWTYNVGLYAINRADARQRAPSKRMATSG